MFLFPFLLLGWDPELLHCGRAWLAAAGGGGFPSADGFTTELRAEREAQAAGPTPSPLAPNEGTPGTDPRQRSASAVETAEPRGWWSVRRRRGQGQEDEL